MVVYSKGPVEVLSLTRNQSSTNDNTGLDYPSALKVEAQIFSCTKALLLLQHTYRPLQEPYYRELELRFWTSDSIKTQDFDFRPAKSVTKAARTGGDELSLSVESSYLPNRSMSIHIERSPSGANIPTKRPTLRSTSSADDLKATEKLLGQIQAAVDAVDEHRAQEEGREHGSLDSSPLLNDEPKETVFPSEVSGKPSQNVVEKKGFRYPRLVLQDKTPPAGLRTPKITLKTTKVNGPRFELTPLHTTSGTRSVDGNASRPEASLSSAAIPLEERVEKHLRPSLSHVPGSYRSEIVNASPDRRLSSPRQSIFTEEINKSIARFGPDLQSQPSKVSLQEKVKSPSLLSTASKSSAYRHALLKSSVLSSQPVDQGLPVPPVLSAATPPASHGSHEDHNEKGIVYHESHPAVDALSKLHIAATPAPLPEDVEAIQLLRHPTPYPLTIPDTHKLLPAPTVLPARRNSSTVESNNEPYWDFVPGVEQSVHDVVQEAVRRAVNDAIAPHRVESSRASAAYRKLVADALAEAANITDQYLRRASIWSAPPQDERRVVSEVNTASFDDVPLRSKNASPSISRECPADLSPRTHDPAKADEFSTTSDTVNETKAQYSPSQYSLNPFSQTSAGLNNGSMFNLPTNLGSYEKLVERDYNAGTGSHAPLHYEENQEKPKSVQDSKFGSWVTSFGNRQEFGNYSTVPTRPSSLRSSKEPTKAFVTTTPQSGLGIYDRPMQSLSKKRRESGRSTSSSVGSAISYSSTKGIFTGALPKISHVLPKPLTPSWASDLAKPNNRRKSIHWLRELLSNDEPYAPRLTALPPRTRKGISSSDDRARSDSAPELPIKRLYLGATPASLSQLDQPQASETFAQTIIDLENLLNEALVIAREASEREDVQYIPKLPENLAAGPGKRVEFKDESSEDQDARQAQPSWQDGATLRQTPTERPASMESMHESAYSDSTFYSSIVSSEEAVDFFDHASTEHERIDFNTDDVFTDLNPRQQSSYVPRTERTLFPNRRQSAIQSDELDTPATTQARSQSFSELKNPEINKSEGDDYFGMPLIPRVISPLPDEQSQVDPATVPLPVDDKYYKPTIERNQRRNTGLEIAPAGYSGNRQSISLGTSARTPQVAVPIVKSRRDPTALLDRHEVQEYIRVFHEPPIQARQSSLKLREAARDNQANQRRPTQDLVENKSVPVMSVPIMRPGKSSAIDFAPGAIQDPDAFTLYSWHSLDGPPETVVDFGTPGGMRYRATDPSANSIATEQSKPRRVTESQDSEGLPGDNRLPKRHLSGRRMRRPHIIPSLRGRSHVSLKEHHGFSLTRSHRRQPIARDWSTFRKRWVATIACISTAMIGIIIGIYAGMVPSIQYYIVDFHHYSILGNVFFFVGLAISTMVFWPLPLLHGRKPYILAAMTIAMPLLFPQAVAISSIRSPYVRYWRIGLLFPRALMGLSLGFANINFKSILTDLFGASLQSGNPHQEVVDEFDVRRHGGGLGLWLGIWTWCYIGSIGIGFMIGAIIINSLAPSWGIYISIIIIAAVLLLNILAPETRRSAYRRSIAEVQKSDNEISRRIARGEVMMHRKGTGPKWWGEEFHQGVVLSINMLRQPGFMVMAVYVAWIYGQVVLIIVLLGSLTSKYYRFRSPYVGACVTSVPIGALLAVPFQKASIFSRARQQPQRTDSMTFEKRVTWSSHLVRRSIFTLVLPFAGLAYTLSSGGPGTPFMLPVVFAALIGFLSNLAIAECHGIIMETFDTSDLQPGMTGRPRGSSGDRTSHKRTNYSSFPRVSSAFAITQGFGFLIAAAATGVGGVAQRHLGQKLATGIMAAILLVLTVLLLCVLVRWKEVQIIPNSKKGEVEAWERARRESAVRRSITGVEEEEPWKPVIIGNPSGKTRRMSVLELGSLSRWSEIRRRNKLIDEKGLEGKHPNLAVLGSVGGRMREGLSRSPLGSLRRVPQARSDARGVELTDLPPGTSSGTAFQPREDVQSKGKSRLSKRYELEDDEKSEE